VIEEMKRLLAEIMAEPKQTLVLPAGTGITADFSFPVEIVESKYCPPGTAFIFDRAALAKSIEYDFKYEPAVISNLDQADGSR
jgi:hypothetical protein